MNLPENFNVVYKYICDQAPGHGLLYNAVNT